MKRVMKSKSGREIYGLKWQNYVEESSCSNNSQATEPPLLTETNHSHISAQVSNATPPPPPPPVTALVNEAQTRSSQGSRNVSDLHSSMYRACVVGDCVAVELLLEGHPNLSCDEISEEGDRALHVAASMKHHQLVQKLVERMSPSDLALLDGRGYTACCYAAIAGSVEIADCMIRKNPSLATARDREKNNPLQKAALRGNAKMVSYFLKSAKVEDFSTREWFDILLATIRCENYGVALEILGINEQLAFSMATMSNDEGTALHLLAGQLSQTTYYDNSAVEVVLFVLSQDARQSDMPLLAEKLWAGIQRLGETGAVELMKNPPILHTAARLGNMELLTMITRTYPQLIWHTDDKGHTFFHIAVKHRQEHVFMLIDEMGATKDFIAASQDANGNSILHLVGELPDPRSRRKRMPVFEIRRDVLWFKKVKGTVPRLYWEMKNNDGETAEELFQKSHKSLLEESGIWMRNAADSCMLIATLIFTVMFGFAFAVPGGYDQTTGIPLLLGTGWFTCFVICECLAMFLSACAILFFLMTMTDKMAGGRTIPSVFAVGVIALSYSVVAAVCVFTSAVFLMYNKKRAAPVPVFIKSLVIVSLVVIFYVGTYVFSEMNEMAGNLLVDIFSKQTRHSLFKRPDPEVMVKKKRRFGFFEILS